METMTQCATCGKQIPIATGQAIMHCDICGQSVCPACQHLMQMHHVPSGNGVYGVIRACRDCSTGLINKGVKPINPHQFIGGY